MSSSSSRVTLLPPLPSHEELKHSSTVLVTVSIAAMKHHDWKQVGRERVYFNSFLMFFWHFRFICVCLLIRKHSARFRQESLLARPTWDSLAQDSSASVFPVTKNTDMHHNG